MFDDKVSCTAYFQLRRAFYNGMIATRNADAQIHGFVVVVYKIARPSAQQDIQKQWKFSRILDGLPARVEAMHFCHDNQISQELFAVSKAALDPFIKTRTRTHHGKAICRKCIMFCVFFLADPSH
mmetsp:Transcript_23640/g.57975  ORF Transcript_23640/g.57975 Transcript_23640/m.57975 type:complete len:125 (+) Transcript_23640:458-832(+)